MENKHTTEPIILTQGHKEAKKRMLQMDLLPLTALMQTQTQLSQAIPNLLKQQHQTNFDLKIIKEQIDANPALQIEIKTVEKEIEELQAKIKAIYSNIDAMDEQGTDFELMREIYWHKRFAKIGQILLELHENGNIINKKNYLKTDEAFSEQEFWKKMDMQKIINEIGFSIPFLVQFMAVMTFAVHSKVLMILLIIQTIDYGLDRNYILKFYEKYTIKKYGITKIYEERVQRKKNEKEWKETLKIIEKQYKRYYGMIFNKSGVYPPFLQDVLNDISKILGTKLPFLPEKDTTKTDLQRTEYVLSQIAKGINENTEKFQVKHRKVQFTQENQIKPMKIEIIK